MLVMTDYAKTYAVHKRAVTVMQIKLLLLVVVA